MKRTVMFLLTLGLTQVIFCQKTISRQLDELMNAYTKVNKFNGTVLVSRNGKIILEKGYGLKNARAKTRNDANSIFQTYSITKTFTSAIVLKLVEQGKLSLSDKLDKFYPGFPKGDSITIEQLLTHTSGVYDFTRGHNMPDKTEQSFLKFIETKPLDFSPGTGWNYSNSGYWLLGFIVKKVTGIAYEELVREYIFKPLHMDHSGFDFKNLSDKNKTTGYRKFSDKTREEAAVYDPPGPFAAGAIYSTVRDLYNYHKGLQSFAIIKEETLKRAYTPFRNNYGYGWIIGSFEGKQMVSHSGGAAGYRSNFARIPEDNICIILLNNHEMASLELITKNILNLLYQKPYKIPVEIKLPEPVLARYEGAFSVKPGFTMYITIEDGRLAVQGSGQPKTIALAEKENYFFAEEAAGFLEFIKDEKGNYNELVIHQGGQPTKASRIYPTWGIAGTATAKGWEQSMSDIQFREDSLQKGLWRLENISLKTGVMLFRLNNDWGYHYGDSDNDKVLDMYGADIKIEEGVYDILLDLRDKVAPRYMLSQKK